MEKPKKPIAPDLRDKIKYPREKKLNSYGILVDGPSEAFDSDYRRFLKEDEKYKTDMELYEQIKFIKLIKSNSEKWALKKVKISRR